ncbi:MAG: hypothetical protein ACQCN4_02600 [Candidatus Bathyarchaeia archaeon]
MATQEIITVPFEFDGETISSGNVKFSVDCCGFPGISFYIPSQYALLLLKKETKTEAEKLIQEISKASIVSEVQKKLLKQACEKGFKPVWSELQKLNRQFPTSEPQFYADVSYDGSINQDRIILLTSEKAMIFYAQNNLDVLRLGLPLNVYTCPSIHTRFHLNPEKCSLLRGHEKELMDLVEELKEYDNYLRGNLVDECYEKFFTNRAEAAEVLNEIRKKVGDKENRDRLFHTLETERFLAFSGGLFIHDYWSTYYISNDGEVHKLCYSKKVEIREAVLRAYEKGKPPTKLEEVKEESTLRQIAEIAGKIRPDLAFVILP